MCHCGQLLFLSSNDRPVQSLDLAASLTFRSAILSRATTRYSVDSTADQTNPLGRPAGVIHKWSKASLSPPHPG